MIGQSRDRRKRTPRIDARPRLEPLEGRALLAPVAVGDGYSIIAGRSLAVTTAQGVLANDTNSSSSSLTALVVTQPAHGSLSFQANGSFTYTPNAQFTGSDQFRYEASDGTNTSNAATVSLNVTADHAPVAGNDTMSVVQAGTVTLGAPGVLSNDTDADGDPLTSVLVSGPSHGQLTLNADGSYTYIPDRPYNGTDSFTYKASDGTLTSNLATVTLTVIPYNPPPFAIGDSYTSIQGTSLSTTAQNGVLANDALTDYDGSPLVAIDVTQPAHGSLALNSDGSFTYTPDGQFSGIDSFTYKANDSLKDSNVATVNITVNPAPTLATAVVGDYNGDHKADIAVYIPTLGAFGLRYSNGTSDQLASFGIRGAGQSIPAPGDYDGSGKTELAVYLPSLSEFVYRPAKGGADVAVPFGMAGSGQTIPAIGDYFGTGQTDIAAYLPSLGAFAIRNPSNGSDQVIHFGMSGSGQSIPVPGDYDGSGKTELAVYLPSLGEFVYRPAKGGADVAVHFGMSGSGQSIPVPGDYDGSGKTELAVYLPSLGEFVYRPAKGGADVVVPFGVAGSGQTIPAIGDYTGVGHDELAAYLPASGTFAIRVGGTTPDILQKIGIPGLGQTIPVSGVDIPLSQTSPTVSSMSVVIPNPSTTPDPIFPTTPTTKKKS